MIYPKLRLFPGETQQTAHMGRRTRISYACRERTREIIGYTSEQE